MLVPQLQLVHVRERHEVLLRVAARLVLARLLRARLQQRAHLRRQVAPRRLERLPLRLGGRRPRAARVALRPRAVALPLQRVVLQRERVVGLDGVLARRDLALEDRRLLLDLAADPLQVELVPPQLGLGRLGGALRVRGAPVEARRAGVAAPRLAQGALGVVGALPLRLRVGVRLGEARVGGLPRLGQQIVALALHGRDLLLEPPRRGRLALRRGRRPLRVLPRVALVRVALVDQGHAQSLLGHQVGLERRAVARGRAARVPQARLGGRLRALRRRAALLARFEEVRLGRRVAPRLVPRALRGRQRPGGLAAGVPQLLRPLVQFVLEPRGVALEGLALPRPPLPLERRRPRLRLRPRALLRVLSRLLPRVRERPLRVRRRRGELGGPQLRAIGALGVRPPRAVEARRVALRGGPALLRVRRAALGAREAERELRQAAFVLGRRGPQFVALGGRDLERLAQLEEALLDVVEQGRGARHGCRPGSKPACPRHKGCFAPSLSSIDLGRASPLLACVLALSLSLLTQTLVTLVTPG